MPAEPLLDERHVLSESAFVELVVWREPSRPARAIIATWARDVEETLK